MDIKFQQGSPSPLGASVHAEGVNFAIAVNGTRKLKLKLACVQEGKVVQKAQVALNPAAHRTGKIWHVFAEGAPAGTLYAFELDGKHLIDPFAKEVYSTTDWGQEPYVPYGVVLNVMNFDWENISSPKSPMKDLLIYEMHVRGFTQDPSSKTKYPGTYLGVIEKIPYLKELGVNAIELLPVQEFNETSTHVFYNKKKLLNYWGYSPVSFMAPMSRYAYERQPGSPTLEFKTMVKELHRSGIEVILDIVYNHTGEGNHEGPFYSFKGLYPKAYYILGEKLEYLDYTGCGNTFNCNHPVAVDLIINALRYWVSEMHIDGFRFDLASAMTRDRNGTPLGHPPLIDAINAEPLLSNVKLIAEPWDCAGLYHVGNFPLHKGKWAEWNGRYRDAVRGFIKGTASKGEFAGRLTGSQDLYGNGRKPWHSINLITCHDGFTLQDLVSYNNKHNARNGEKNKDGTGANESWNCGAEGITSEFEVQTLRQRQKRNFLLALFVSQGVPMVACGDENSHSKKGNNNTWCQDNGLNWFQWDKLKKNNSFMNYFRYLVQLRRENSVLRNDDFLTDEDIQWHGIEPFHPQWDEEPLVVAYRLIDRKKSEDLFICFNGDWREQHLVYPEASAGKKWNMLIDTASDLGFYDPPYLLNEKGKLLSPYSSLLLKAL